MAKVPGLSYRKTLARATAGLLVTPLGSPFSEKKEKKKIYPKHIQLYILYSVINLLCPCVCANVYSTSRKNYRRARLFQLEEEPRTTGVRLCFFFANNLQL